VTTRTWLLALHITSVAGWLGANFVQIVLTPRFGRERPDVAAAWTRQQIFLGRRYYNVVGALIGVSGVLLVLDGDWDWSSGFIWVGIAVLVLGGVMGVAVFGPLATRRLAALESGESDAAARAQRRIMPVAVLDTALVVLAVLAMVHKWAT
jgi:hypothetical protein